MQPSFFRWPFMLKPPQFGFLRHMSLQMAILLVSGVVLQLFEPCVPFGLSQHLPSSSSGMQS